MAVLHPAESVNCTVRERLVLDRIMNNESADIFDRHVINKLVQAGLLSEINGDYTPPAIVWSQWKDYQNDRIDNNDFSEYLIVEIFGHKVGVATTWDQSSETMVLFSDFQPFPKYAGYFGNPGKLIDLSVDLYKGIIQTLDQDGTIIKEAGADLTWSNWD